jgi:hypothetical protein
MFSNLAAAFSGYGVLAQSHAAEQERQRLLFLAQQSRAFGFDEAYCSSRFAQMQQDHYCALAEVHEREQRARYRTPEQQMHVQYRTPEQQLHALAEAHAEAHEREQRGLRNSIRGRTWKCGPWTWET